MPRDKPNFEGETKIVNSKSGKPLHYVAKVSGKSGNLVWRRAPSGNAKRRVNKYTPEVRELIGEYRDTASRQHVTLSKGALKNLLYDAERHGREQSLIDERQAIAYDRAHRRRRVSPEDIQLTSGMFDYSRDDYDQVISQGAPARKKKPASERQKLALRKGMLTRRLRGKKTTEAEKASILRELDDINRRLGGQIGGTGKKRQRTHETEEDDYEADLFDPASVFPGF